MKLQFTGRADALKTRKVLLTGAQGVLDAADPAKGLSADEKAAHTAFLAAIKDIDRALAEPEGIAAFRTDLTPPSTVLTGQAAADSWQAGERGLPLPGAGPASYGSAFAQYMTAHQGRSGFSGGGLFVDPAVAQPDLFPSLIPASVALSAGVRVLALPDGTMIPYVSARPTTTWLDDEDAEIPAANTGFGGVPVWFKKLAGRTVIANDLRRSATLDVMALLIDQQVTSTALGVDLAIFEGTGAEHQVRGLKYRDTLGAAVDTNGAALTDLDDIIGAISALEAENAKPSGFVMAPRTWGDLMKLRDESGSLRPLLGEIYGASATAGISRRLLGLPVHLSSQLSTTEVEGSSGTVCSSIYLGQWSQAALVRDPQQQVYVDIDESENFSRDQSQIRVVVRVDLATPNPKAFFRLRGIKASS